MAIKRKTRHPALVARKKGSTLTPADRELVVQTYFATGTYHGTANKLGLAVNTITGIVRAAYDDPELLAVRSRSTDETTGRVIDKMGDVISSIGPEDLESGAIQVFDAEGQLVAHQNYGPSLRDKAFTVGQLATAHKTMTEARLGQAVDLPQVSNALMMPETADGLRKLIAVKLKKLRIVEVEFGDGGDTMSRMEHIRKKSLVSEQDVADAEITDLDGPDPFD